MNGQDVAVFMALEAPKYINIALEHKYDGSGPTIYLVSIVTQQTPCNY